MLPVALPFGIRTPESKREPYRQALRDAGLEPVETPASLDNLAGLLLAGGSDIDPAQYNAARQPETGEADPARDALEIALLREALARGLPVLAICRGLQLLNVALGGALHQHIEGHRDPAQPVIHPVSIAPATRLAAILNPGEYTVNSRHHQAAAALAPGLIVSATAPGGIVEALELPSHPFCLAVQWHPEERLGTPDAKLFQAFRAAMRMAE
jgi:putative glutamine amidotransferase